MRENFMKVTRNVSCYIMIKIRNRLGLSEQLLIAVIINF